MAKKKNELSLNFKIERSNQLNQLSPSGMSLTEIRFLAIYQAKINARNPESRVVTFPLEEFCNVMEVKELNVPHIKKVADSIICKPVHLPDGEGGLYILPLFNNCHIRIDKNTGKWYVDITCHDKVLPYMFEMKKNYFTYELWNALKLKSVNQVRMYEILKQYEKLGNRIIELDELKRLLGVKVNKKQLYSDFRKNVLEVCQRALKRYTDITFTFEPIKQGRKIHALKFYIEKNKDFKDDLKLKEFINPSDLSDIIEPSKSVEVIENSDKSAEKIMNDNDMVNKVYIKCGKSYTIEQIEDLMDLAEMISDNPAAYVVSVYRMIKVRSTKINNLYNYTLSVIQADLKKSPSKEPPKKKERETSYDKEEFKNFIRNTKRIMTPDDYVEEVQSIQNNNEIVYKNEVSSLKNVEKIKLDENSNKYDDFEEILKSDEFPWKDNN